MPATSLFCGRAGEFALAFEVGGDLCGRFRPKMFGEFLDRCFRDALDRTKFAKELHLSLLADAGNFGKFRCEVALLAAFAVKLDRGLVRLFAYLKYETEREGIPVKGDRRIFTAVYEQVRDLVMPLRRFDETDEHYLFEVEAAHRFRSG